MPIWSIGSGHLEFLIHTKISKVTSPSPSNSFIFIQMWISSSQESSLLILVLIGWAVLQEKLKMWKSKWWQTTIGDKGATKEAKLI